MTPEIVFRQAFLVLLGMILVMRIYFMVRVRLAGERLLPDRKAIQREGNTAFAIRLVGFFALLAFLGMYFNGAKWIDACAFPLPDWLRWAGFGLGIASVAFSTWAQVTLDIQWSAQLQLRQEHQLVTQGPYSWIRHPIYTGLFAWSCALALLTANWIFAAIAALSMGVMVGRVPREEKMMLEAFGEAYQAYMQRTGRFLPRLKRAGP